MLLSMSTYSNQWEQIMPIIYYCPHQVLKATSVPVNKSISDWIMKYLLRLMFSNFKHCLQTLLSSYLEDSIRLHISDESEPSWRFFSSARLVTFFHSARNEKSGKNEPKFWFWFWFFFFWLNVLMKMIKSCT